MNETPKADKATPVVIREARGADAGAVAALYRSLVQDPHIHVRPEHLDAIAADPNNYLLVCEVNGIVCGTALLTICLEAMYGSQPYGVLENVAVSESWRGHGLGSYLLGHVEELCRRRDCSKMMLLSTISRVQSHRFFEHHGFSSATKRGFVKYRRQSFVPRKTPGEVLSDEATTPDGGSQPAASFCSAEGRFYTNSPLSR